MYTESIEERLARMTPGEHQLHKQAVDEGFEAEKCPDCGVVLLAHHHFVICDRGKRCPMSDGVTLLERMRGW